MAWTRKGKFREAIERNDIARVARYIDQGMDVRDSGYGWQPLLAAVFYGHKDMAALMIRKGANFSEFYRNDGMTEAWQTLLHVAARQGHVEVAKLLLENDRFDNTLVNKRDSQQNTALHLAAQHGHLDMVRLLLDHGFDPKLTGANGKLPIGLANQSGKPDIVDLLHERMAPKPKPAPAPATAANDAPKPPAAPAGKWRLADDCTVASVTDMPELGYKITELFNFSSRERTRIVNNLKTKADTVQTSSFDELRERAQLEEAFAAFKRLGGRADGVGIDGTAGKPHRLKGAGP